MRMTNDVLLDSRFRGNDIGRKDRADLKGIGNIQMTETGSTACATRRPPCKDRGHLGASYAKWGLRLREAPFHELAVRWV